MRKMPLMDAFFLINESRRTPMHVGGLNLYTLPKGANATRFLARLGEQLRQETPLRPPFGEKLRFGPLGALGPIHWEPDDALDMDYHIRHSALPSPGRYRELFVLVSRLHSTLLDRSRPMWEMHLIEGLQGRQFATYFKAHHCAMDGMAAMHLTNSMLSTDARKRLQYSPFSMEAWQEYRQKLKAQRETRGDAPQHEVTSVLEALREQLGSTVNIATALREHARVWLGADTALEVPWHHVPQTELSTRITGARRFVAQSWSLPRVRAVGRAMDATLNDIVLAMCGGALRAHLLEQGDLPDHSLKAMAPISLREEGDTDSANAVGFIAANLATNVRDPEKRLRAIQASMDAGKAHLRGMSRREVEIYTMLTQLPLPFLALSGMGSRFPAFSTIISNVPGPRQQMYWNGARLDGLYPVSIPFDGAALNITLVSNKDSLDFGIVACRRSVPQVQRMIDYIEQSLVELEHAAGLRAAPKGRPRAKRRAQAPRPKRRAGSKRPARGRSASAAT